MAAVLTMNMSTLDMPKPSLSIDLSDLPTYSPPSPPSNTLLITKLESHIFTHANLDSIQRAINSQAQIHTFAPLKLFRRIIVSFYSNEDAIKIRRSLEQETVLANVRVYFGQPTKIEVEDQHLRAPQSQKLFFISPPPSPPVGWTLRNEDPPNKEMYAEDLAAALSRLHARPSANEALEEDMSCSRRRSGSMTIVYNPGDHGHSPDLPAIAVEDLSASPGNLTPMGDAGKRFFHTSRPPVELMEL